MEERLIRLEDNLNLAQLWENSAREAVSRRDISFRPDSSTAKGSKFQNMEDLSKGGKHNFSPLSLCVDRGSHAPSQIMVNSNQSWCRPIIPCVAGSWKARSPNQWKSIPDRGNMTQKDTPTNTSNSSMIGSSTTTQKMLPSASH